MRNNNIKMEFLRQKRLVESATKEFETVCKMVVESVDDKSKASIMKKLLDGWKELKSKFKNPDDVKRWFNESNQKMQDFIQKSKLPEKAKKMLVSAFNRLKFAVQKDDEDVSEGVGTFLKKHWLKILVLIYFLALFIPGAYLGFVLGGCASQSYLGAAIGGVAGGFAGVWYGTLALLSHIPLIGPIFGMLMV